MRSFVVVVTGVLLMAAAYLGGQNAHQSAQGAAQAQTSDPAVGEGNPALLAAQNAADSTIKALVARLEIGRYKATIKGLTEFGDRRQATQRNRDAVDWIE